MPQTPLEQVENCARRASHVAEGAALYFRSRPSRRLGKLNAAIDTAVEAAVPRERARVAEALRGVFSAVLHSGEA